MPKFTTPTERPTRWARPMSLEGVPNLHQVSETLFRSAQPNRVGMKNLRAAGIETVVNLRSFRSDRREIGHTGLAYEHIYMKTWQQRDRNLVRFLQIIQNPRRHPVLVHCLHGADRTGMICATYRVFVEGWSKEEAVEEMVAGGYGFHRFWQNMVRYFLRLDCERIRQLADSDPLPATSANDDPKLNAETSSSP